MAFKSRIKWEFKNGFFLIKEKQVIFSNFLLKGKKKDSNPKEKIDQLKYTSGPRYMLSFYLRIR